MGDLAKLNVERLERVANEQDEKARKGGDYLLQLEEVLASTPMSAGVFGDWTLERGKLLMGPMAGAIGANPERTDTVMELTLGVAFRLGAATMLAAISELDDSVAATVERVAFAVRPEFAEDDRQEREALRYKIRTALEETDG